MQLWVILLNYGPWTFLHYKYDQVILGDPLKTFRDLRRFTTIHIFADLLFSRQLLGQNLFTSWIWFDYSKNLFQDLKRHISFMNICDYPFLSISQSLCFITFSIYLFRVESIFNNSEYVNSEVNLFTSWICSGYPKMLVKLVKQ